MKYYVVRKGRQTGIFDTREKTQQQVSAFPKAQFKSFPSLEAARLAREQGFQNSQDRKDTHSLAWLRFLQEVLKDDFERSICSDAACPSNPGPVEYRGVVTSTKEEIFALWPLEHWSVNLGEFLGIVHGLSRMSTRSDLYTTIFSDSKIAISWVKNNHINTSIARTADNQELWRMVDRAQKRLSNNPDRSQRLSLKKRNTAQRGEIPADFWNK